MIASPARTARRPAAATRPFGRALHRLSADPHMLLVLAIVPAAVGAGLIDSSPAVPALGLAGLALIAIQSALSKPALGLLDRRSMRHTVRLIATLAYIGAVNAQLGETGEWPAVSLFLPVVALAAALGRFEALWVGVAASLALVLPVFVMGSDRPIDVERGLALGVSAALLAIGTRRAVSALEGSLARARRLIVANRRRAAQLAAVDEVSRLVAVSGPTSDVLAGIMSLFERRLGYRYVSIYLGDERRVCLGAQVGYAAPILEFDGTGGVIGRAMRTRQAQFLSNVGGDPDYWTAEPGVRSEICTPLLAGDEFLGLINVEAHDPLAPDDLATLRLVADRVAAALALAREREELGRRADMSRRIVEYASVVARTLEAPAVYEAIVVGVTRVLHVPFASLVVLDHETGRFTFKAIHGADARIVGAELRLGEGVTGRAIRDRALTVDPSMARDRFPVAFRGEPLPDTLAAMAVPLMRDNVVVGGIAVLRDATDPFEVLEQETFQVVAGQAALALTNAELLAQVTESSLRDPLTGLFNRRYLDASLARMQALRDRQAPAERRPVAAILFDLDHFGELNKRHGHQVGDTVLQGFAEILRERTRSSDIVARYGGEEFLILLEGASPEATTAVAESVRSRFADRWFEGAGEPVRVTVSAGCGTTGNGVDTLAELVRIADAGLAMAKRGGRDQVVSV